MRLKTEFIVFKSKCNVKTSAGERVQVGCNGVTISPKVKNLEVIFELSLPMQSHVNTVAKVCYL